MGRNQAISIGINKYDFLTPLKYAKRDAELMQQFLHGASFEQVFFFSDDSPDFQGIPTRPSRNNLRRLLRQISKKPIMATGDNLWFFFSGHGMQCNGRDYLMPCDGDSEDVEHTAISIDFVTECLRGCGAGNVILMLDACRYQGSKSGLGIGNQAAEIARQKGVVTFFSCSPNQLSYEIETLQQGIFTKAMLEGLGIQGQCATVERLNHYLSVRVPELIREHKGEKVQQMPYCIAEPVTKSHLIICPQYATLQDVSILKNDAYQAELNKDYGLAKQLWIRVLGASTGDMEAINGIQRIAISQIENERYSQGSSVSGNAANKSVSPLSPKSTPVVNTIPTEPDVPLKSERGVDYTKSPFFPKSTPVTNNIPTEPDVALKSKRGIDYTNLRDLLAAKKWKEADEETARVMLKAAGKEKEGRLDYIDFYKFPCEDLLTIDQLWVKYSNRRFGFSVQKRIYQSLGGTSDDWRVWEKFGDKVGWRKKTNLGVEWLYYNSLTFSEKAPEAHLPSIRKWIRDYDGFYGWSYLASRLVVCNIPTEPDVPLKLERGVDYTNLRDLLAAKKWKEADDETTRVMLKVAGREKKHWLDTEDIEKFPCEDLRTIDQLWVKYSNGRYGFSVQKRIYQSLGGTSEYDREVWERFCDKVGWRKKNRWLDYDELTLSEKAPEAHLPFGGWFLCGVEGFGFGAVVGRGCLISRRDL